MAWSRSTECCRRLTPIPGVGPFGAVWQVRKAPVPQQFASGRQVFVWAGLTPGDQQGQARWPSPGR
ncbi:transposase [Falsigemmobacter faecalis]